MRRSAVFLSLVVGLAFAASLYAEDRTLHLSFTSTHQSMWGPGSAPPPINTRFTLLDPNTVQFDLHSANYPALQGPFVTYDTWFWGDISFGFGGRARAATHLGLWADVKVPEPGSVDVTYPLVPTLNFPDANSFRAGDTVTITSNYSVPQQDFSLVTRSPKASLDVKGDVYAYVDLYGQACVVACLATTDIGVPSPLLNVETGEFQIFHLGTDSSIQTPPELGIVSPFSGFIHAPNIDTVGAFAPDHTTLTSTGSDNFAGIRLDLTSVAEEIFHLPPLSLNTDDYGNLSSYTNIHFHYTVINVGANAALNIRQDFNFAPDPKVVFTFPEPLQWWVNGGAPTTSQQAEMRLTDSLHVVTPSHKTPTPFTPTFRLDNQFHSETTLHLNEFLDATAGAIGLAIDPIEIIPQLCTPGFCVDMGLLGDWCVPEICTPEVDVDPPDFDLGPIWSNPNIPIASQNLGTLVAGTWQMSGFNTATDTPLSIDPENPILNIVQQTGNVKNLGGGKRLVPFAIDLSNPGDVKLNQLTLTNSLQNAFSDARSFTIDHITSCNLNVNPSFDGNNTTDLLTGNNELGLNQTKRLTVFAIVSPKPDPAPYNDRSDTSGRSPIQTLVNGNASSSVLLGPSNPGSAADFVLYADQFVKLDSTGNIFGNIGSNNSVEVKNGSSGVVAGDLRGARYIKVSGQISADYAISGGVVDVVGNGRLTLFGNAKPFSTINTFTMSSPAWTPGPLIGNIWVPAGGSQILTPGYYGNVTVNNGAVLELQPGTYYMSSLSVLSNGTVHFGGPVNLINQNLAIGSGASISGNGSSRDGVINMLQTGDMTTGGNANIRGTVIAPRSNLFFGAGSNLEGSFFGKSITMNAGTKASYHNDCDPLIDGNCDGVPDCP